MKYLVALNLICQTYLLTHASDVNIKAFAFVNIGLMSFGMLYIMLYNHSSKKFDEIYKAEVADQRATIDRLKIR